MTLHSIVVAFDATPPARAALDEAAEIAHKTGAHLTILGVVPLVSLGFGVVPPAGDTVDRMLGESRGELEAQAKRLEAHGLAGVSTHLLEGDPVASIVHYVEKHPTDLVVVGSRGLGAPGRFFLGSISDGILHHVGCSVLIVKSAAAETKPSS
jgi:nucleotide-binding universal stress UspA family protein